MSSSKISSKSFYLFSFLPALAYWYLEANYSVPIAVTGGIVLAVLEILIEKIWLGHVHKISKLNFFIILVLGGLSLIAQEGVWFKLQPCFTGLFFGPYMLVQSRKGGGPLTEMALELRPDFPFPGVYRKLEIHSGYFFLCYGLFMGGMAFWGTTDQWLFFKTAGFYLAFGVFFVIEFFLMGLVIRRESELAYKAKIFSDLTNSERSTSRRF